MINFLIASALVIGVFAGSLYETTYEEAYDMCASRNSSYTDTFDKPGHENDYVEADLYVGKFCLFRCCSSLLWLSLYQVAYTWVAPSALL